MTSNRAQWHADHESLLALVDGDLGPVSAASLEAHLMRCAACRGQLNALAFTDSVEQTWTAIRAAVEAPRPGVVERMLCRLGVSAESGRLLAAVPAMRGGWLAGVSFVLAFAGLAAGFGADLGISMFLLVAPLAPVAGVAAAFGGDADPSHEIVVTAPYSAARLLLLRTAAVLATCTPVAMLVGLTLPGPGWLAVAWLTPAAAGIAVTLALAPVVGLTYSASAVGVVWSVLSITASRSHDPLALTGPAGQLACLCLAAISVAVILSKSQSLELLRRP
jgi:anti-sigma factor RsiW